MKNKMAGDTHKKREEKGERKKHEKRKLTVRMLGIYLQRKIQKWRKDNELKTGKSRY